MKYKFKIGDKVKIVVSEVLLNGRSVTPAELIEPYMHKAMIVTDRTRGALGNEYSLTSPDGENGIAWLFEEQLKKVK